jgi:hypothetical protein
MSRELPYGTKKIITKKLRTNRSDNEQYTTFKYISPYPLDIGTLWRET